MIQHFQCKLANWDRRFLSIAVEKAKVFLHTELVRSAVGRCGGTDRAQSVGRSSVISGCYPKLASRSQAFRAEKSISEED